MYSHCKHCNVQTKTLATYVLKHLKHLHIYVISKSIFATSKWNTYNIGLKHMKHLERTCERYMYRHCKMCNVSIYICNIDIKHLQHISEISETLETYACNMRFQCNVSLLPEQMEARRCGPRRWWRMELVVAQRSGVGISTIFVHQTRSTGLTCGTYKQIYVYIHDLLWICIFVSLVMYYDLCISSTWRAHGHARGHFMPADGGRGRGLLPVAGRGREI
jgi:hypothetical protein